MVGKMCMSDRDGSSLERIVKADSRIWVSFTKSVLRLESVHPHTDVSGKWTTNVAFLLSSHF